MSRCMCILCLSLPLLFSSPVGVAAGAGERDYLVFGFLPIVSSERLVRRFAPLADYLSRALGVEVRMETAPNFAEFLRRTHQDRRYDILFTAPHFYYRARQLAGYRAVTRVGLPGMRAVIVVRRDSALRSIHDLRGRRLATADRLALATALVRRKLLEEGLDPDHDLTLVNTPSHNASLLSAYQGRTDAASLMLPLYRHAAPEIRAGTRILAETESVPHMPISVGPWVDDRLAERIRIALLQLGEDEADSALLVRLDWPGFVPADPDEYDGLDWALPADAP